MEDKTLDVGLLEKSHYKRNEMIKEPKIKLSMVSNLWIKLMTFENAGDVNEGHEHEFDHITLLTNGSLEVDVNGTKSTFTAPQIIYIQKKTIHTMTALEDNTTASCVVAIRDSERLEDIVDPDSVPKGINHFTGENEIPAQIV
jgi:quercetin dioxygenase-like cupin family protein